MGGKRLVASTCYHYLLTSSSSLLSSRAGIFEEHVLRLADPGEHS